MISVLSKKISPSLKKQLDCIRVSDVVNKFKKYDISFVLETTQVLDKGGIMEYVTKVYCGEVLLYTSSKETHDMKTVNQAIKYIAENTDTKITLKIIEKLNLFIQLFHILL